MKTILVTLAKALGIVIASYGAVIGIAFGVQEWVIKEAKAVVKSEIEVVKEIRKTDMEHLDKRFDRLERLITREQR
jgi:hypothetical protein